MKKILAKSAMAIAIATISGGVFAGTLAVDTFPVKLAEEVFGDGTLTNGSEQSSMETLVATPAVTYTVTTANVSGGALGAVISTVKVTLDKGAVFGEDLSDIAKWTASTANVVFGFAPTVAGVVATTNTDGAASVSGDTTAYTVTVDSGGAIGDNTVVFKITSAANGLDLALKTVALDQIKTKNLTSALKKGGSGPVRMGVEYRRVTAPIVTDTATAAIIFESAQVAKLDGTLTTYLAGGGRARIDVADTEKTFTGVGAGNTGANASQDFDETDNSRLVTLGTLKVIRNLTGYAGDTTLLKKENGDEFDFQGSDEITVTLTSATSLSSYSAVYLSTAACAVTTPGGSFVGAAVTGDANSVKVTLTGQSSIQLETGYNVCAVAKGDVTIPEAVTFDANLNVEYFNPRYTRSQSTFAYGPILRNGCQVTLFNLPTPGASDDAFIRLTNVSEKSGSVRAFIWTEDGQKIDVNSTLVTTLAGHATTVLHTSADQATGVYLGSKMPTYAAATAGRHRLVLQGAFPACEALGLIRTPAGVLTNMTSTTYSGDDSRLGADQSGTSNTSN
jgi:hypothetical protein